MVIWVVGLLSLGISPNTQERLSIEQQDRLLDRIETTLLEKYISLDVAERAMNRLRTNTTNQTVSPKEWCRWANEHLFEVSGDLHLQLWFSEERSQQGVLFKAADNFGFQSCRSLPGNIAYIRLDEFSTRPEAKNLLDATVAWAKNHRAVLLDLRFNRGGSGQLVLTLLSHFFKKPTLVNTYRYRYKKDVTTYRTPKQKKPAFLGKPLAVITSEQTASAAEIFVNAVKSHALGEIIGERTMGLGNVADIQKLEHGISLLFTHGYDAPPSPGKNWQGKGIEPDREHAMSEAVEAGHRYLANSFEMSQLEQQWLENALNGMYGTGKFTLGQNLPSVIGLYHLTHDERGLRITKQHMPSIPLSACGENVLCQKDRPLKEQVWVMGDELWWVSSTGKTRKFTSTTP